MPLGTATSRAFPVEKSGIRAVCTALCARQSDGATCSTWLGRRPGHHSCTEMTSWTSQKLDMCEFAPGNGGACGEHGPSFGTGMPPAVCTSAAAAAAQILVGWVGACNSPGCPHFQPQVGSTVGCGSQDWRCMELQHLFAPMCPTAASGSANSRLCISLMKRPLHCRPSNRSAALYNNQTSVSS